MAAHYITISCAPSREPQRALASFSALPRTITEALGEFGGFEGGAKTLEALRWILMKKGNGIILLKLENDE